MQKNDSAHQREPKHIALFGGTFCPVHNAHLAVALFLQAYFQFDEFIFLPNKTPTLDKTATASPEERLAMLDIALAPYPFFTIDKRELNRTTPSYTVDTLVSIRKDLDDKTAISFIMGMDNFKQLHRWHDWQKILTLCNIIVIDRPNNENPQHPEPLSLPLIADNIYEIVDPKRLSTTNRGGFFRCHAGTYAISSTTIRNLIRAKGDAGAYLPPAVLNYIKKNHLFK